jgi:tetratricopeptide (TPR) repeat protein
MIRRETDSTPTDSEHAAETVAFPGAVKSRRRWRPVLFRTICVTFPILLVVVAEVIARWSGFGGYPPIVKHVGEFNSHDWYSTYRPGVDSFFNTKLSHTGGMREWHFTTPKPKDTVRILMLGGSAMQGWPQELGLTNGAFLTAMLEDVWGPNKHVEVINFGATAMASFPVTCFLDAMLPHDLDLVIVMAGNNEFFGAYGVSSLHSAGASTNGMRFTRWLRGTGLWQVMDSWAGGAEPTDDAKKQPLMERVVVRQQIGPDDRLRTAAAKTIRNHLNIMVDLCVDSGVPIIVCSVPVNERGLAPIGEELPVPLGDAERAKFEQLVVEAEKKVDSSPQQAADELRAAIALYSQHARSHYLLGRALTNVSKRNEALAEYGRAVDLDTMPWRAVSAAQMAARDTAERGAVFCDLVTAFRHASPQGAIDWELMDDHVHMSLRGQALFAQTLVQTMTKLGGPVHVEEKAAARLPDWETYAKRLGASDFTDYVAISRIDTLMQIPFMRRNNESAHQRFAALKEQTLSKLDDVGHKAIEHWHDPGLHVTNHRPLTFVAGYYYMMSGDYEKAAQLFPVARASLAKISLWRLQLTWYLLKCHQRLQDEPSDEDFRLCEEGIEIGETLHHFGGFHDPMGPMYLGILHNLAGNHQRAVFFLDNAVRYARGPEGWDAVRALADSLAKSGKPDRARLLLTLSQKDPAMKQAAQTMLDRLAPLIHSAPAADRAKQ